MRITTADADDTTRARFHAALARGDLATWSYDGAYADAAADPKTLLPGACAVVCVAFAYARPAPAERRGRGRVSNYAWSRDYHRRVRRALDHIAAAIDGLAGGPATKVACDTAPLAERAFAARAGLGWIGKHTSLIVKGLGPSVFLGEIVTTLPLAPDVPLRTSCGSCTRCIDVCPTGALRGDGTMDATRCISDLTQRRDAIPRAMRPLVGAWVWGCDLCNTVCPPQRRAGYSGGAESDPVERDVAAPDLLGLLRTRGRAFRERFGATGMGWLGAHVLRRNAAVALGNEGDRAAVPDLAEALASDTSALVRGHAAWALGRIASPRALGALRAAAELEADSLVREEIAAALEPPAGAAAFHLRRHV